MYSAVGQLFHGKTPQKRSMTMPFAKIENLIGGAKPFEAKFLRRKISAMLLTAFAAFLAMCVLWAFSNSGFRSHGEVVINCSKDAPAQKVLQQLVSEEMADDNLSRHILVASEKAGIENDDVINRRFPEIREAFEFKISKHNTLPEYQLSAEFDGHGSDGERVLLKSIMHRIAQKIEDQSQEMSAPEVDQQYTLIQGNIEKMAASRHAELEDANQNLQHLDADLSVVFEEVASIRSLPDPVAEAEPQAEFDVDPTALSLMKSLAEQLESLLAERDLLSTNESSSISQMNAVENDIREVRGEIEDLEASYPDALVRKQSIPALKVSHAKDGAIDQALRSIESLDTHTVRTKIDDVQTAIRSDAVQQREDVATLRMLTGMSGVSSYTVREVSPVKHSPKNIPTGGPLLLFGLAALAIGSVVSTYFRPEMLDQGFESAEHAGATLGIPVVGQISAPGNPFEITKTNSPNLANRVVWFSEILLFAFLLVVIFLCFTNNGIRQAFFENPLHGVARIAWMFLGR